MKSFKNVLKKVVCFAFLPAVLLLSSCGSTTSYYHDKLGGGSSTEISTEDVNEETTAAETNITSAISSYSAVASAYTYDSTVSSNSFSWVALNTVDASYTNFTGYYYTSDGTVDVSDGIIRCKKSGTYYFYGTINTSIQVKKEISVQIYFIDVTLTATEFDDDGDTVYAGLYCKKSSNVTLTLIGTNSISNTSLSGTDNAIRCKSGSTLCINGSGSLSISSSKSGINVNGTFYGLGGSVSISAGNHGISAYQVYLSGISVSVTSSAKDGIHAEVDDENLTGYDTNATSQSITFDYSQGFVYVGDGTSISISGCYGDGIQADTYVWVAGGTVNIETVGVFTSVTASSSGLSGMYSRSGSSGNYTYTKVSKDDVTKGKTYYTLSESVKGIKVGEIDYNSTYEDDTTETTLSSTSYCLQISGGTLNVKTSDDALHVNTGSMFVSGGTLTLESDDDAMHADYILQISGGDITITDCYEGIEATLIEISGGEISLSSSDDGINASSATSGVTPQIVISGGVTVVSATGDGVDSNGSILISGGELYVSGPSASSGSAADAALDADSAIVITGGIVVAVGPSGMVETPSTTSTQCVVSYNLSSTASGTVVLKDSSGNTLISYTPDRTYSSVIISCPSMSKGSTYTLKTGSSSKSFTASSSSYVTTLGTSVGGKK